MFIYLFVCYINVDFDLLCSIRPTQLWCSAVTVVSRTLILIHFTTFSPLGRYVACILEAFTFINIFPKAELATIHDKTTNDFIPVIKESSRHMIECQRIELIRTTSVTKVSFSFWGCPKSEQKVKVFHSRFVIPTVHNLHSDLAKSPKTNGWTTTSGLASSPK